VTVSTTSGDVSLAATTGRLGVATASGDVDARIESPLEAVSVETTSGDVSLGLPEPAQGRLEVVTASGDIVARGSMTLEQANRRRLVAVLGPGAATISIHTASGDVHVGPAGER
jgi:lia operon protein LiaG